MTRQIRESNFQFLFCSSKHYAQE